VTDLIRYEDQTFTPSAKNYFDYLPFKSRNHTCDALLAGTKMIEVMEFKDNPDNKHDLNYDLFKFMRSFVEINYNVISLKWKSDLPSNFLRDRYNRYDILHKTDITYLAYRMLLLLKGLGDYS